jgi:hypothetical protein
MQPPYALVTDGDVTRIPCLSVCPTNSCGGDMLPHTVHGASTATNRNKRGAIVQIVRLCILFATITIINTVAPVCCMPDVTAVYASISH